MDSLKTYHKSQLYTKQYMNIFYFSFLFIAVLAQIQADIDAQLTELRNSRQIRGLQLEITLQGNIIYRFNIGYKNNREQPIDDSTVVRIASLSKSFATVGLMQLIQQNKISLSTTISNALGFQVKNPYFPQVDITLEMILSHQSSIVDCDPYYLAFLYATYNAKNGDKVPNIKDMLHWKGQYYNRCIFINKKPGTFFEYCNFNYGIIGTIIERVTGIRFDVYQRENILKYLKTNTTQIPTFAPWTLTDPNNLAVLYRGQNNKWIAQADYYPDGVIPEKNYTTYRIGTNGLLFSPQAGLRASTTHLNNYVYMLANRGVTKQRVRLLSEKSVAQILKSRYQFHGPSGVSGLTMQNYGLGITKTGYISSIDQIIKHQVVFGHNGDDCGLLSGYHFWGKYTFSFYFTGIMKEDYTPSQGSIYEEERKALYSIVNSYYQRFKQSKQAETQ